MTSLVHPASNSCYVQSHLALPHWTGPPFSLSSCSLLWHCIVSYICWQGPVNPFLFLWHAHRVLLGWISSFQQNVHTTWETKEAWKCKLELLCLDMPFTLFMMLDLHISGVEGSPVYQPPCHPPKLGGLCTRSMPLVLPIPDLTEATEVVSGPRWPTSSPSSHKMSSSHTSPGLRSRGDFYFPALLN